MGIERTATLPPLPARPSEGHKGLFGRVLVVGGSEGMIGAPVFAGTSALRMGSGLVQLAVPRAILSAALSITPELIGIAMGKTITRDLLDAIDASDAIALGPGMGKSPEARQRLLRLIRIDKPMVIDADGLNILASQKRWPRDFHAKAILTPHPGEMKRLAKLFDRPNLFADVPSDDDARIDIALKASNTFEQIVVLKGHRTIVTDGRRVYVNRTGDSTLSKAGTGDVLTGIIASLLGQRMDRFDVACVAVHLHGRCGEIAGNKLGPRCALAREVIDAIPQAVREYEREVGG